MTAARQRRKPWLALVLLGVFAFTGIISPPCWAADEKVEVDRLTGIAISGFDPVAYFVEGKPRQGRPDLELNLNGQVWRFANAGNRAAFVDNPDIYGPRFGGYDPVAIARGASVPGHPLIWAVAGERLYLFYSSEARTVFLTDPGGYIERAERKWPQVEKSITR